MNSRAFQSASVPNLPPFRRTRGSMKTVHIPMAGVRRSCNHRAHIQYRLCSFYSSCVVAFARRVEQQIPLGASAPRAGGVEMQQL